MGVGLYYTDKTRVVVVSGVSVTTTLTTFVSSSGATSRSGGVPTSGTHPSTLTGRRGPSPCLGPGPERHGSSLPQPETQVNFQRS